MPENLYRLTPSQLAALRALNEDIVELSPLEVAVRGRLQPNESRSALGELERLGLVSSWVPVTGRTGEHLYVLAGDAQLICQALDKFKGIPAVGTVIHLPRQVPAFSGWLSRQPTSAASLEVIAEPGSN